jgi:di/tricarboxylate transporter
MQIAITLGLLVLAIVLFITEKLSVDIVTLILLVVLITTGILSPAEAFSSFGNEFIIILASIFIITKAIEESGVLDAVSSRIARTKPAKLGGLLVWLMPFTSFLSAFMNNTTVTALLIPPVLSLSKKSNLPVSKVLMPLAFASIVGGTCTLIGTSTNVAVSAYLSEQKIANIGMFDFVELGIILAAISFVYMLTIGKWLLPAREEKELADYYEVREYLSEIKILENSPLIGQPVIDSDLNKFGFKVISVIRNKRKLYWLNEREFAKDDVILVTGNIKELLAVKEKSGIDIVADTIQNDTVDSASQKLFEVLIPANSTLAGITVKDVKFRQRYGLVVVAIHRSEKRITQKIGSVKLEVGDLLLVQGLPDSFKDFHDHHNLIVLDEHTHNPNRLKKGYITIALFIAAVVASSFSLVPLSVAFLVAAVVTVLLSIVPAENVYHSIDWRMLVLIGGMSAFGIAMVNSGADKFLSSLIVEWCRPLGASGVMIGFMILTVLLTQPMSNAAAALVVLPIALQTAALFHVNPVTYAMAIMLSASVSLATPFEPSCIMVYGPGKYKFFDFVKVGGLLTLILMTVIFFGVKIYWPLQTV